MSSVCSCLSGSELGCCCWLGCMSQGFTICCWSAGIVATSSNMVGVFLQWKRDDIHWRQLWRRINLCDSATTFLIKWPVSESSVAAVFSLITQRVERQCISFFFRSLLICLVWGLSASEALITCFSLHRRLSVVYVVEEAALRTPVRFSHFPPFCLDVENTASELVHTSPH